MNYINWWSWSHLPHICHLTQYLVIEAPTLTDEAAVNLQDFFNALMDAIHF